MEYGEPLSRRLFHAGHLGCRDGQISGRVDRLFGAAVERDGIELCVSEDRLRDVDRFTDDRGQIHQAVRAERPRVPRCRRRRSEEHTSELQSLMRISYAVFCLKKKKTKNTTNTQDL